MSFRQCSSCEEFVPETEYVCPHCGLRADGGRALLNAGWPAWVLRANVVLVALLVGEWLLHWHRNGLPDLLGLVMSAALFFPLQVFFAALRYQRWRGKTLALLANLCWIAVVAVGVVSRDIASATAPGYVGQAVLLFSAVVCAGNVALIFWSWRSGTRAVGWAG